MDTTQYIIYFVMQSWAKFPAWAYWLIILVIWSQLRKLSWGHKYLGLVAVSVQLASTIINTLYPDYNHVIRPAVTFIVLPYYGYMAWWFYQHPKKLAMLGADEDDDCYVKEEYQPTSRLAKQLMAPVSSSDEPWYTANWMKAGLGFFLVVILYLFMLKQLVLLAVASDRRVAQQEQKTAQKMDSVARQVKNEVKKEVKADFKVSLDTLKAVQDTIKKTAVEAKKAAGALNQRVEKNTKDLDREKAKKQRPAMYFIPRQPEIKEKRTGFNALREKAFLLDPQPEDPAIYVRHNAPFDIDYN